MAADHGLTEVGLTILDRLVETDPEHGSRDSLVFPLRAALLDALIRLDPPVDPWRLLPQATGRLEGGVALFLLRHPLRYREAALALFMHEWVEEDAWLALGNVLARTRAPGFASRLLRGLTLALRVRVWTGRPPRYREPGGSVPGDGYQTWPSGFPPVILHLLDKDAWDCELVADGPRPVYVYRQVWDEGELGWGISGPFLDRNVARLEWLGRMVPLPKGIEAHTEVGVSWGGTAPFVRDVVARRTVIEDAWRETSRRLRERGLLTRAEAEDLVPRVVVNLEDHRTWAVPALPPIPASAGPRVLSR